jgi:hypothetical protein
VRRLAAQQLGVGGLALGRAAAEASDELRCHINMSQLLSTIESTAGK